MSDTPFTDFVSALMQFLFLPAITFFCVTWHCFVELLEAIGNIGNHIITRK